MTPAVAESRNVPQDLPRDVVRLIVALLEEKAWFRRGLADNEISRLTGLTARRVVAARRQAESQGLAERRDVGTERAVTMLTPAGVARAQQLRHRPLV